MTEWKEPKTDYVVSDQVTPNIFNDLGDNEKHLKEIKCEAVLRPKSGTDLVVAGLVFVEV